MSTYYVIENGKVVGTIEREPISKEDYDANVHREEIISEMAEAEYDD